MVPIYSLGKIYLTRPAVILLYIFSSVLSVICGLVNYIFLTLYVGGKWAGNFGHPFKGLLSHQISFRIFNAFSRKVSLVMPW